MKANQITLTQANKTSPSNLHKLMHADAQTQVFHMHSSSFAHAAHMELVCVSVWGGVGVAGCDLSPCAQRVDRVAEQPKQSHSTCDCCNRSQTFWHSSTDALRPFTLHVEDVEDKERGCLSLLTQILFVIV